LSKGRGYGMNVEESLLAVGTEAERRIQSAYGSTARAQRFYDTQMLDRLNEEMISFIGRQEMMFVATADAIGRCDNTFRSGPPGFVTVLDDRQVAWPEYRGNGVHASLANISESASAGLLFIDFFQDVIGLHVNGRANIVEDAPFRQHYLPRAYPDVPAGRRIERWVLIGVEEAYIHCRKHIPRLAKRDDGDVRTRSADVFGVARSRGLSEPTPMDASGLDGGSGACSMS
jgi:predicted pyridoxine 5'-phosphate oxidase superfamily flavin-nucleotide-binding protein